jgi:GNAT superfamily N-acetyltransferase
MIQIRRAVRSDAAGMANVHVGAWRSTYAGILPDRLLTRLSMPQQALYYQAGIESGRAAYVAEAEGRVIGFATASRSRSELGEGEIETLYVLDDWREQGVGRGLMQATARRLARAGCRSAFLWVLRDNPSRWFYQRLGGRRVADAHTMAAGVPIPKTAYAWDPIDLLLTTTAPS